MNSLKHRMIFVCVCCRQCKHQRDLHNRVIRCVISVTAGILRGRKKAEASRVNLSNQKHSNCIGEAPCKHYPAESFQELKSCTSRAQKVYETCTQMWLIRT